jgi:hypothetical protein
MGDPKFVIWSSSVVSWSWYLNFLVECDSLCVSIYGRPVPQHWGHKKANNDNDVIKYRPIHFEQDV